MLSDADRKKAADILMSAEKERKQAVQLSKTWPDITIEDSYAISTEVAKRKIAAGAKLIGHKVGLTSKAMQRSSQIDEPDYGHLLDNMLVNGRLQASKTASGNRPATISASFQQMLNASRMPDCIPCPAHGGIRCAASPTRMTRPSRHRSAVRIWWR